MDPKRIQKIREDSKMNKFQFAVMIGINPAQWAAIESGKMPIKNESSRILLHYIDKHGSETAKKLFMGVE